MNPNPPKYDVEFQITPWFREVIRTASYLITLGLIYHLMGFRVAVATMAVLGLVKFDQLIDELKLLHNCMHHPTPREENNAK